MGRTKGPVEARVLTAFVPAAADGLIGIRNAARREIFAVREFDFINSSVGAVDSERGFSEDAASTRRGIFLVFGCYKYFAPTVLVLRMTVRPIPPLQIEETKIKKSARCPRR